MQSIYANHLHKDLTPARSSRKLLAHVSAAQRKIGLVAILLALAATWLLPALHTPCELIEDHPETCCSCSHDEHELETSPATQHTHHDHNEQDCGLCQIMLLGAVGTSQTVADSVCCGSAPLVAINSQATLRPPSILRPRHLAARGPPIG